VAIYRTSEWRKEKGRRGPYSEWRVGLASRKGHQPLAFTAEKGRGLVDTVIRDVLKEKVVRIFLPPSTGVILCMASRTGQGLYSRDSE